MIILWLLSMLHLYVDGVQSGKLNFVAKQWPTKSTDTFSLITYSKDQSCVISCETNDPNAVVTLLRSKVYPYIPWRDALATYNGRMKKIGQKFVISTIVADDAEDYKCVAQNEDDYIELLKGRLEVATKGLHPGKLTGTFAFTTKQWFEAYPSNFPLKRANINAPIVISCETNDRKAVVSLYRSKVSPYQPWTAALPTFGGRMKLTGQHFQISSMKRRDEGDYKCIAENEMYTKIELLKGRLISMAGKLTFVTKQWPFPYLQSTTDKFPLITYNKDKSFVISCETNDPSAVVSLLRSKVHPYKPWRDALPTYNGRMKKIGQKFVISTIIGDDAEDYKCIARNQHDYIELIKGRLEVSSEHSKPGELTGELAFTTEQWFEAYPSNFQLKRVNISTPVLISCQTNDRNAVVTLLRSKVFPYQPWTDAIPTFGGRMKLIGQYFWIASMKKEDEGDYKCIAENQMSKIELLKGRLTSVAATTKS